MSGFTTQMPTGMTAAERLQRANSARPVTDEAVMKTAEPAAGPAPAATPAAPAPAAAAKTGLRPWEKAAVSAKVKGGKQRLPLNMSAALRAKLEYLAEVLPGETLSSLVEAGIEAECQRKEKELDLLPDVDGKKVRPRVVDKHASAVEGSARLIAMIPLELQERMDVLIKEYRAAKDRTALALPGIEDECNRRLKERGEL